MLALQLGNCIGHGLPFLGMYTVRSRVLCFGFEGTTRGLAQRLQQQLEGLSINEPGMHIAFKEPVTLDDRDAVDDWVDAVERHAPCMLIVDPFAEAHTSDEVKDGSVLLGGLRRLQRAAGGPAWVLHHPNQDTKSARLQRVHGHGSHVGAADAVYWQERPDRLGTLVELSTEKVRDIEGISLTALEFDPETCLFTPTDARATTRQVAIQLVQQRGRVLRADVARIVASKTGKSRRAVERAIGRALDDGQLVLDGDEHVRLAADWEQD